MVRRTAKSIDRAKLRVALRTLGDEYIFYMPHDMNKLPYLYEEGKSLIGHYETFMKLAGPYWMSCVTKNDATPILDPDHYRTYLGRRV